MTASVDQEILLLTYPVIFSLGYAHPSMSAPSARSVGPLDQLGSPPLRAFPGLGAGPSLHHLFYTSEPDSAHAVYWVS